MAKLRVDKIAASGQITENTGSVFFDGSSDWLRARGGDNFNDFNFGSSDFTIEGFFYANDVNGTDIPIALAADTVSANSDAGWYIRYQSNKIEGKAYSGSSEIGATQSGTVSNNTWYHVAYVREGSTFTLYVDGVAVSTATSSDSLNWNSGWKVEIGSGYGGANYFAGYISNLRICKGHAVYKSNFAPPTRELEVHQGPDDDRTVLLACHDGENIFADKTGRHILASQGNRTSSPTLAAGETPVGITTFNPGLTRSVDATAGPTFQGGAGFTSQNWLTLPKGTTTDRNRTGGRGISGGASKVMEYIQISSMGNALDFGDMTYSVAGYTSSCSSSTRGLISGGFVAPNTGNNTIDAVTIATTGNAVNFGDIPQTAVYGMGGCSSSTRGLFAGGYKASSPAADAALLQINYVTIATFGNAQDFGDLTEGVRYSAGASSPTRGIFAGGRDSDSSPNNHNIISYVTIATLGNAQDFGDLLRVGYSAAGNNSSTRAIIAGGYAPGAINQIDYITISTLGNAQDFGDLIGSSRGGSAGMSNSIRGVFAGGANPSNVNAIEYVNIASTGDGQQFGDLITASSFVSGISDSHGGIS